MTVDANGVPIQDLANPAPASGEPENPEATSAPGAVNPDPSLNPDVKTVPLPALQDERVKRQEAQSQLSAVQAQLSELQGMIQQQHQQVPQQPQYGAPQPQTNPLDGVWNNEEAWNNDPKAAVRNSVQAEILAALQWYDSQGTAMATQEAAVMNKYADYGQYKVKIEQQLKQIPFNQRTQAGTVEAAYFMAKGQGVDKLLTQQQQTLIDRIKRGELVQGLAPGPSGVPPAAQASQANLTEDQMKVAAMMNLTPEQYASSIVRK